MKKQYHIDTCISLGVNIILGINLQSIRIDWKQFFFLKINYTKTINKNKNKKTMSSLYSSNN